MCLPAIFVTRLSNISGSRCYLQRGSRLKGLISENEEENWVGYVSNRSLCALLDRHLKERETLREMCEVDQLITEVAGYHVMPRRWSSLLHCRLFGKHARTAVCRTNKQLCHCLLDIDHTLFSLPLTSVIELTKSDCFKHLYRVKKTFALIYNSLDF